MDQWQPTFEIPSLFEIHDLSVTVDQELAFANCIVQCGGTMPNGGKVEDWVRATLCFRKVEGEWKVAHQHISMPISRKG